MVFRIITLAAALSVLAGCTSSQQLNISYSGRYNLTLSGAEYKKSTIFDSDMLSVKTKSKKLISGMAILSDYDSLPENFDMSLYTRLINDEELIAELPLKQQDIFRNTKKELKSTFPDGFHKYKIKNSELTVYCNTQECRAFLENKRIKDQLLFIYSTGYSEQQLVSTLKIGLSVNDN